MYGYVREGERAGVTRQRIGGVWFAVATVPSSGLLAGYLCRAGVMTSRKRVLTALIGGVMILVLIGPILDTCTLFTMSSVVNTESVGAVYLSGLPFNAVHGAAVFLTLLVLARPMIEKLDRIKVKYGMMEAE